MDIHGYIHGYIYEYYAVAPPNEIEYLYALSLQYFLVCRSYSSFSRLFMLLSQMLPMTSARHYLVSLN